GDGAGRRRERLLTRVFLLGLGGSMGGAGVSGYFVEIGGSSPQYRFASAELGPLTAAVSASGNRNAVITVQVGSQVSGQIKELLVDFNSVVTKGQVIARIDPAIFEAKLIQARADLDSAKAAVLNQQAQVERSRADVGNARAAHAEARAQTAKAQVAVLDTKRDFDRKTELFARQVDVGQTVAASLQAPVLFTIAQDLTKMQVETSVDEADIGRIKLDDRATFTVDAFPGETFEGTVTQIRKAGQIVQNVVTYTVVVAVDNPAGKLLPGMTANVKLVVAEKPSVLKVPNAALRFRPPGAEAAAPSGSPGGPVAGGAAPSKKKNADRPAKDPKLSEDHAKKLAGRVWILGPDGKPAPVRLALGLSDGSFTEVLRGDLKEGQEVIVGLAGSVGGGAKKPKSERRLRL